MAFLEANRKSRTSKKTKKDKLVLGTDEENLVIYFFTASSYFIKKNIIKILLFFLAFYLIYSRFRKKEDTEMIDGMEVPKLKDNYDLSLD